MKKIYTLLLITSGLTAFSQPIVEATYLPVHNTVIKQVYDTVAANLVVPTRGPNQVWNYSNSFTNILDTFDLQTYDASTTPHFSHFPNATHASFLRAPFLFADSVYSYFIVDTNGIQNLGFFSEKQELDTQFISAPTEWVINSTVNYGDLVYDTSRTEGILKDYYFAMGNYYDIKYVSYRYKKMEIDGYGTLSTPLGTFNDVLLGTEKQTVIDSFFVDLGFGWNYAYMNENHFHRFHFLRNNTFATTHLMQLNSDTAETVIRYGWYTLPADIGSISGTVNDTTGLGITSGEMILYREHSNFTKNDILATTQVDASGNYQFDSIPYGEYRVACRPDLNIYINAMTTYVGDTTDWINCQTIITTTNSIGNDINLIYHEDQTGAGSISGSLQQDFSFSKGSGDPIPGIDIIIEKTPSGAVNNSSGSNAGGGFSFNNLNDGDYTIFVDIPGLNMNGSYNFTISGGTTISGLDFKVGFDSIHPVGIITTIQPIEINKGLVSAYPNPFSTNTTIEVEMKENSNVEINIFNILGKKMVELVNEKLNTGNHTFNFSAESYAKGIYFAKIKIDDKEQVIKLIQK
ncbi:MAG: hypothetical protein COB15_15775 [Flavobacteriales bacterium]|nr:MAG: hypothetical protein COB15_15775 [Flavobacteriales bacterium]